MTHQNEDPNEGTQQPNEDTQQPTKDTNTEPEVEEVCNPQSIVRVCR